MTNEQTMTKVILDFAEAYAAENSLESADVLTALAHGYVIYGFSVKKDDTSDEKMREALIGFVTSSADHMIGAIREEA